MARTKAFDQTEVLEKALQIFWKQGYDATSMQDLVDGLGISRSSIYGTFGDKRQLYLSALREYQRQSTENLAQVLAANPSPRRAIEQLLRGTVSGAASDLEGKGCFMVNAAVEEAAYAADIAQLSRENKTQVETVFSDLVRRGQAMGEISGRFPAEQLAGLIYIVNNGVQAIGKYEKDERKLRESVELVLSLLDE